MAKIKNIPELRFPEFTDKWDSNLFGNIASFYKGKGVSKADINEDGETECIRYGELYTTYNEVINDVKSKTNIPVADLILSEENDVIIPASGETQIDIARASCVIRSGIALGGDLNVIKSKLNGIYLAYYLNNTKKKEIAALAQGISVVHLYSSQLKTLSINYPQPQEQEKIATFLIAIDKRITLLTQQKEQLELYKKGLMQKIFSREIRFKDDNGRDFPEWKENRLGEIGTFQTSSIDKLTKENESDVYLVNYMNVYRHESINNKTVKYFQVVTAKSAQIESCNLIKGDILFTPSSETPEDIGHSVVIFEDLENAVFSYHLMRFRPKIEIDILYSHYFCNIPSVLNQLSKLSTGSTRFTISVKSFSSVVVNLPSVQEQVKIATFLSKIDSNIDQIICQINDSVKYKKNLMQKMFV